MQYLCHLLKGNFLYEFWYLDFLFLILYFSKFLWFLKHSSLCEDYILASVIATMHDHWPPGVRQLAPGLHIRGTPKINEFFKYFRKKTISEKVV